MIVRVTKSTYQQYYTWIIDFQQSYLQNILWKDNVKLLYFKSYYI